MKKELKKIIGLIIIVLVNSFLIGLTVLSFAFLGSYNKFLYNSDDETIKLIIDSYSKKTNNIDISSS